WEDPSEHLRRSPITYVGNVKTPTMLMTGDLDLRTPMEQTEQFYRALKLRKVDTVMVRIADEYHGLNAAPRHPSNRLQQILVVLGWVEKDRKKGGGNGRRGEEGRGEEGRGEWAKGRPAWLTLQCQLLLFRVARLRVTPSPIRSFSPRRSFIPDSPHIETLSRIFKIVGPSRQRLGD